MPDKTKTDMEVFLKEAFCIDGDAVEQKEVAVYKMPSVTFKLTDSVRGEFYVTISKAKP